MKSGASNKPIINPLKLRKCGTVGPRQVGEGGIIWALRGAIWVFSLLRTIIELSEIL